LLALVLPRLVELAAGSGPGLPKLAARALGRAGQLDPLRVTFHLMQEWAKQNRHDLLGPMLEGIMGSGEPGYRRGCLGWVHELLGDGSEAVAATTAASLWHLSNQEPDPAIEELKQVALSRFKIRWEELRSLASTIREVEAKLRSEGDHRTRTEKLQELTEAVPALLDMKIVQEETLRLLGAVQYSLDGLVSFAPVRLVLSRLIDWMQAEPDRLGPLVAFLFLRKGGISGTLRPPKSASDATALSTTLADSWLRDALDEEVAPLLCRFLGEVFHHTRPFPGAFRGLLESSFRSLLGSWADASRADDTLRPAMIGLLAGLFAAAHPEVGDAVLRMAKEPVTGEGGDGLRELAVLSLTSG
nr:hypothetical protein [Acidobacteriota bacterium]